MRVGWESHLGSEGEDVVQEQGFEPRVSHKSVLIRQPQLLGKAGPCLVVRSQDSRLEAGVIQELCRLTKHFTHVTSMGHASARLQNTRCWCTRMGPASKRTCGYPNQCIQG
jgi:hypothetical protein